MTTCLTLLALRRTRIAPNVLPRPVPRLGVIDVGGGESVRAGLTREVDEETGLLVEEWAGPVYQV